MYKLSKNKKKNNVIKRNTLQKRARLQKIIKGKGKSERLHSEQQFRVFMKDLNILKNNNSSNNNNNKIKQTNKNK